MYNYTKNIIFVDTAYLTFNKFYAVKRWYSYKYPDDEINNDKNYDWFENNIFINKFKDMYLKSLKRLFDILILDNCKIIFCLDASYKQIWRTTIYENYKKGRLNKYNYANTMKYLYNILLPDIIKNNKNYYSIYVDEVEADDVIATSVNYLKKKKCKSTIYIVTNDTDLKQLGDENIYFINLDDKKFIYVNKNDAEEILIKKILYGDKSDNIKSIFKPGYKINNNIIRKKDLMDNNILYHYLQQNNDANELYKLNTTLVNLDYLPIKYKEAIIEKIKIII